MTTPQFTVLIPSHSHGPLLELAGRSALDQTVTDMELFIVLDGADHPTRDAARRLADLDTRVRVFDNPKGRRAGERHRHTALEEATGRFVAYLSDDDLWLPHHLEHLAAHLEEFDFVAAQAVFHDPDGGVYVHPGDVGRRAFRSRLLADPPWNFVGLSQGSHTMAAYRSLERGWHPAPPGIWTDLHMWRHFLERDEVTAMSSGETTVFAFPSPKRREMTLTERFEEMAGWADVINDPQRLASFLETSVSPLLRRIAARELGDRWAAEERLSAALDDAARAQAELAEAQLELDELGAELDAVRGSLSYRAAQRLAGLPVIGRIGRRVAGWLLRE